MEIKEGKKEKRVAALCLQCSTQRMGGKGGKRKIVRYAHLFNREEGGQEVKEGKKGNEDCGAVLAMVGPRKWGDTKRVSEEKNKTRERQQTYEVEEKERKRNRLVSISL